MSEQQQTPAHYLKSLSVIYLALITVQVVVGLVMVYMAEADISQDSADLKDIFIFIVPIVILNGLVTGNFVYRNQLKKLKTHDNLILKMRDYRGAAIVRFAFLESAYLFSIVVYFLTVDFIFLAAAAFVLLYFIMVRPTVDSISVDLELSAAEKVRMANPIELQDKSRT